ncbi:MAG: YDG domain-containing protein, partial [Verrucomicrobiota bacterium]
VYDGLTAMPSAVLKLDRGLSGDSLVLGGNAAYVSRSAGTGVAYSLTNLALSGSDAGCYLLTASSLIAHDGVIAPRPLSLSGIQAISKAYDGNASAALDLTNVVFSGQVFGDTLSVTGATGLFADKNVGSGKGVAISSLSLAGADAGNYTFAPGSQASTADITQLASVLWVGGATGNWFDPANWAGGAVPDLANVRDVIIPAGSSVSFGSPAVAPAQFGPVTLASLSGGGSLALNAGDLAIGTGGLALGGLDVTGGDLVSQGPATIGSYLQSGGIVNMMTDLSVTASFNKTGGQLNVFGDLSIVSAPGATLDGLIFVQGNLDVISSNGPLSLGSVTVGGDLGVTTNGGAITQTGVLDVTGTTGLNAGGGDITLSNPGNLFGGA